jgi:pectin methylesterase-like acyl-CoA thioesterase
MRRLTRTAVLTTTLSGSVFLGCTANAAERYVDNSVPAACSDSSDGGSQSRPWCAINYAVDQAEPGDIVYVKNGIYAEEVYIEDKNGGESYITIRNYPGHSPIIQGRGVHTGRNKIIESSFIKFIGFTITNVQQGLFVEESSNIILQNIKVYNICKEAVRIKSNSSFVTLQDSVIHDTRKWKYNGEGVYIGT